MPALLDPSISSTEASRIAQWIGFVTLEDSERSEEAEESQGGG
jgi:hypothetical protein